MKCEVLRDASLIVKAGSIVEVDSRQYELARAILKPIVDKEEEPKKEKKSKKKE